MAWPSELEFQPEAPAADNDIAVFVESVFAPLTDSEIEDLVHEHKKIVGDGNFDPPFDPSLWQLPNHKLPDSYLEFLRFSNGGFFGGENRDLDPLFTTHQVREYMLAYSIPHWMPKSCPIGFDGGGTFYLLDMRKSSKINDYPVLLAHAGNLGYDNAMRIADSFAELLETKLGES